MFYRVQDVGEGNKECLTLSAKTPKGRGSQMTSLYQGNAKNLRHLCPTFFRCLQWFHMPKICPFYGHFGIESVPDPSRFGRTHDREWAHSKKKRISGTKTAPYGHRLATGKTGPFRAPFSPQ